MTISIIIAVAKRQSNLEKCVDSCLRLNYQEFEIIILPDNSFSKDGVFFDSRVRIIPTGNITPPYKRDIGAKESKGEVLAFLDDDAYPVKYWLDKLPKLLNKDSKISCVCGPAVTPADDSILEKASGLVYSSLFVSGNHIFRYIPKEQREVFDFPSCNFFIKKELFNQVGGFEKPYWPGEDTFLCLKVLDKRKKMIYDPKVLVYHHRRPLFKKHLNQIKNYALHRGYFAKRYPKTSLNIEYFIPTFFVLGVLGGGTLSFVSVFFRIIYLSVLVFYFFIILVNSFWLSARQKESPKSKIALFLLTFSGTIVTHITYGLYFIKGIFAKRMPEE